ncbi:unnamed protein product [Rotaria magnacalcarata]|uniref:Costars domain-containing protein n=3 Tax=Rotaria magnacalcarata TaxID=392030 RepID=A0A816MXK7_9BILA|nr:unnamed protein product [Rotaria magnacalcarata]CAF2240256.1 unnamed protein product [Rotaria magnacalcarata]CAF4142617.1 unnamed protein product [Rotaria magnacalcarata]CAF4232518.1 unnamed protein product [Rotaria magnacalcarata]
MTFANLNKPSPSIERRSTSVLVIIILVYLLLILTATLLFTSGVIQGFILYQPGIVDWLLMIVIGIVVSTSILGLSSWSMWYNIDKMSQTRLKISTFDSNSKLVEWEYNIDEWNSYLEYIYINQRLVCPVVWRFYGRWRRFKRFITCGCTSGRVVFYKTGILIDELFVVIFRPNGLILSQIELVDINEQIMLRLHLLAVRKETLNSPMHAPCHVDILVPRVIQEPKKRLESLVEYLSHTLSKTSDDDDEISNDVLKHQGKIPRIIEHILLANMANTAQVEHEISLLVNFIRSIGKQNSSTGKYETTFGDLFRSDEVQNTFESLAGTLKAAKRRKVISYSSELLLQGVHDKELITLEAK